MINRTKNIFFWAVLLISLPVSAVNIWMEAENGAEYDPILVGSDLSASDDNFLVSWRDSDYSTRTRDDGVVIFTIGIPEDGEYTLWGRIRVPENGAQPYDISLGSADVDTIDFDDDSLWTAWAPDIRPEGSDFSQWAWRNSGFTVSLTAGTHSIRLSQRVGGSATHIDKILLTTDTEYEPSGLGEAEPILDIINPYQSDVVSRHGQLQVGDAKLKNADGQEVQLRGVSTHGLQWFPLSKQQTIPAIADFFNADVVRLAMYIEANDPNNEFISWGGYEARPEKLLARMEQGIEDAIAAGIYVIVDWHIHNVPANYLDSAVEFFSLIAEKYGDHPNVIYEICNEPVATAWSQGIKPYAETVISAIREHDPDNLIIVGTPNWSQDVEVAAQDPLDDTNVIYAFHYYAATHNLDWAINKVTQARNDGIAIFVSEWGSSDVGTATNDFDQAQGWLDFLNENKISWVNWSLGVKDETSSILSPSAPISGPWINEDLSNAGAWLKPQFADPETPEVLIETREAETVSETVGNVVVGDVVGYFDPGDAIIYDNVNFDQLTQLNLYVSGIRSNQRVEFRKGSINGPLLGFYDTQSTGGWNTYVWRTFDLASTSGIDRLVMLATYVGSGGGLMNLDKFQLVYHGNDNPGGAGAPPLSVEAPETSLDLIFDFETSTQNWFGRNVNDFRQENGQIRASLLPDPQFRIKTLELDSMHYNEIKVCMETSKSGEAEFFWSEKGNEFVAQQRYVFDVPAGEHCTDINLQTLDLWQGTIQGLRIDPPGGTGDQAFIDLVHLKHK